MRVWPADYDSECYVLLPIPVATIPIVAGALAELEKQDAWASRDDWLQGYQFAVCLQECLVECGQSFSESMTLLAVALGANEVAEADLAPAFPALAARLAVARAADTAGVLAKADPAESGEPSAIIRFEDIARLQQGKFPDTGSLWWQQDGKPVTLYDLYQQEAGLSDEPVDPDGKDLWDYLADILGITDDIADFFKEKGIFGKIKKDGVMIALLAVEYMNLSMNTNILINLVGHQKIFENSPGAPAATNDYLEAMLKATRGAGIKRSETDWKDTFAGTGRPPTGDPPPDSVLWALRGVTDASKQASDTRNVIDKLDSTAIDLSTVESSLSTIATNTVTTATNTGNIEGKIDALLQGGDLGDGRVNLYTLNQNISGLLLEMQTGQLYQLLVKLTAAESDENFVSLYDLGELLQSIANNMALVEGNSSETALTLGYIRDHTGILPILADQAHRIGYTNLYDLLQQLICICKATNTWLPVIAQKIGEIEPVLNIDGGYAPPAATLTAPPANLCQRVRWLVGRVRTALRDIMSAELTTGIYTVESVYMAVFNVKIPRSYSATLSDFITKYIAGSPNQNYIAMSDYITSIEDELICALYNATDSANAKLKWDQLMDSKGAGALAAPDIVKHAIWNGLLTEMYEGNIPRNAADLDDFSSDCSGCAGGGSVAGNTYNFSMELNTTPGEWNRYPFEVPNDPDPPDEWYFLIWELDVTRLKQGTESAADWSGVTTYKTNTADTIGSLENTFNLKPFISNGAGMTGWQIRTNFDQSQQPDPGYDVYFASDPTSVADLQAGTLLTTSWQPLPSTGRVCVYAKGILGLATNAWAWMLIQLQAP